MIRRLVQGFLERRGLQVVRQPLAAYLRDLGIDLVLDVGANVGQYGRELRRIGYRGRIVSFEPLSRALQVLQPIAAADGRWDVKPWALGATVHEATLNVSRNLASSSILPIEASVQQGEPDLSTIDTERISVRTLDTVWDAVTGPARAVFMKVDTQGFEKDVLLGATAALRQVRGIQLELSLTPLYAGEPPAETLMAMVRAAGFTPSWIVHGYRDPASLRMLQFDLIALRIPGHDPRTATPR